MGAGNPIGREPEAEPVPFSETTPEAEAPHPEPEGDAAPTADAPEPEPATPEEAGPTATAHAGAASPGGPLALPPSRRAAHPDPESERALVDNLVARWRAHRAAPQSPSRMMRSF